MLLSERRGEQEAECGARRGEQAGQQQTLPGPEYRTSEHVLKEGGMDGSVDGLKPFV